ncbi:hypothetical protein RHMOL_Rhmol04G0313900 [Rhododendron molle]|uniref:Uncharacterized protein n=1 Tax=Rhododendron molle TaxID=49168 RepID=A0ACC0P6N3_RHOML|nr:hypothetical protein RHMOL_Rhmol04G0313900 [Rhododendron molle]
MTILPLAHFYLLGLPFSPPQPSVSLFPENLRSPPSPSFQKSPFLSPSLEVGTGYEELLFPTSSVLPSLSPFPEVTTGREEHEEVRSDSRSAGIPEREWINIWVFALTGQNHLFDEWFSDPSFCKDNVSQ